MLPLLLSLTFAAEPPPSIDDPVRTKAETATDAAVVIGIEDYAFLPDVPHARRDAQAVKQMLMYSRGLPTDRVHVLNGGGKADFQEAILGAKGQVAEDGALWIYFAGHGATSADGDLVLVGDDAKRDPTVFALRSLPVDEIVEMVGDTRLMLITDACYAGVGRDGEELFEGTRFAVPSNMMKAEQGATVWSATTQSEVANAYNVAEHGLFTYFMVGALRGWADGEIDGTPDGVVTLEEAQAFVSRAIPAIEGPNQTPAITGDSAWTLITGDSLEAPPDMAVFPNYGTKGPVKLGKYGLASPLLLVGGKTYQDSRGTKVAWSKIMEMAAEDEDGALALKKRGGDIGVAIGSFTLAGGTGAFATNQFLFETQLGDYIVAGVASGISVGAITYGLARLAKRGKRKSDVLGAAQRVVSE